MTEQEEGETQRYFSEFDGQVTDQNIKKPGHQVSFHPLATLSHR